MLLLIPSSIFFACQKTTAFQQRYSSSVLHFCLVLGYDDVRNTVLRHLVPGYSSPSHSSCSAIMTINRARFSSSQQYVFMQNLSIHSLKFHSIASVNNLHQQHIIWAFHSANTSYALELFSIYESAPLFTTHFTSPAVATYQYGVKTVYSNTVLRIGSLTKFISLHIFHLGRRYQIQWSGCELCPGTSGSCTDSEFYRKPTG